MYELEEDSTAINVSAEDARTLIQGDMNALAGIVAPEDATAVFPELYLQIWSLICMSLLKERDFSKFAIALPRGHAKTFVVKLLALWAILFTKKRFILCIGASTERAKSMISDICDFLDNDTVKLLF